MTRIILPGLAVATMLLLSVTSSTPAGEVAVEELTITNEGFELESSRKGGAIIQYDHQHEQGAPSSEQETFRATSKTPRPGKGSTIRIDGIEGESVDKDHKSYTLD